MQGSTLIPSVRYRDARAGIAWLVEVLGFERKAVYDGPNGTVAHAELTHGAGMLMLGSASNANANPELTATPQTADGRVTSVMYLCVADCEPVYAKALAAGATMVQELRTMDYGGKAFTICDPEGYVWSVGEYDPWAAVPVQGQEKV